MNPAERDLERLRAQMRKAMLDHQNHLAQCQHDEFRVVWGKLPLDSRAGIDLKTAEELHLAGWAGGIATVAGMVDDES